MSILGILIIYIKTPAGSIIKYKKKRDHTSTLELNMIIINTKGVKNNNLNNSNNNGNKKKLKFPNLTNIIINKRSLGLNSSSLLYSFKIIILLLKEENKLFILPI